MVMVIRLAGFGISIHHPSIRTSYRIYLLPCIVLVRRRIWLDSGDMQGARWLNHCRRRCARIPSSRSVDVTSKSTTASSTALVRIGGNATTVFVIIHALADNHQLAYLTMHTLTERPLTCPYGLSNEALEYPKVEDTSTAISSLSLSLVS